MKKVVVLFSGGIDSTICLALAQSNGFECFTLAVDYGQKHAIELEHAANIAKHYAVKQHRVVTITSLAPCHLTSSSALSPIAEVPHTYVPARNTIFLSIALGWCEQLGVHDVYIGANADDFAYPDCRPSFFRQFEKLAQLGSSLGDRQCQFTVHTPLIDLNKQGVIALGKSLDVDFQLTWSCYFPDSSGLPCKQCDSCHKRRLGLLASGLII
jgi:7-cyano-7-deazaguanine synthase